MIPRSLGLRFVIDTNRINARRGLPSMNQIEKWYEDDIFELFIPEDAQWESVRSKNQQRTAKALSYIALEVLAETPEEQQILKQIETILSPNGTKSPNDHRDAKIVFTAWKYFAPLITNDGQSKSQPGGILGHASDLLNQLNVIVMQDIEAVTLIEQKILERDTEARRFALQAGEPIPGWVGKD